MTSIGENKMGAMYAVTRKMYADFKKALRDELAENESADSSVAEFEKSASVFAKYTRMLDYVDFKIMDCYYPTKSNEPWRKSTASEKQTDYLKTFGIEFPKSVRLTKGTASDLINAAKRAS
jgi:hypothetical protein